MTQTKDFAFSLFHLFFPSLMPKQQFDSVPLSFFYPAMVCIVFREKKFSIKQTTNKQQFVSRIEFNKHWEAVN